MKNITRGALSASLVVVGTACLTSWHAVVEPSFARELGLQQLAASDEAAQRLVQWQAWHQWPSLVAECVIAGALIWGISPWLREGLQKLAVWSRNLSRSRLLPLLMIFLAAGLQVGCMKPYDKPEFHEIDTSETGFVLPLEGDTTDQVKFASISYLQERKVAAKRVQITHRWVQLGRLSSTGLWVPTVRLIKVNRSPETRSWTAANKVSNDTAIWVESADSVGFSMGFNCTAFISEEDAAKFLYWYPSGSLAGVMDSEIRARIQQSAAEVAAKYPLDNLRSRKQEIVDAVKADLIPFFRERGITVTTVGMFGGMTYENSAIQKAIDETFIAQQLKVISSAKYDAQLKENERVELEAEATAERLRREAQGKADARLSEAKAEADSIRAVNSAVKEAEGNPMFIEFRRLEVEKERVGRWDGRLPTMVLGNQPNMLFNMPLEPPGN
jgi:regulator of protease activity HflC (stomatin/prohibitin superfamily)